MRVLGVVSVVALSVLAYWTFSKPAAKVTLPDIGYFGSGTAKPDDTSVKPFKVHVPDETLQVHFIRVKPPARKYKKVVPLLIVHGWPGNVFEFYKAIPMLVDPQAHLEGANRDIAFEVVAPSIPGFGYSEQPHKKGFGQVQTARVFNKLMTDRLGFQKYLAQGGDWGSAVTSHIARLYPQRLFGLHLNMLVLRWDLKTTLLQVVGSFVPSWLFSDPAFHDFSYKQRFMNFIKESGYFHLQATKPDTVGVALNDSPVGLLAYVLEKFSTCTNPSFRSLDDGGLERKFTKDELLTIITIYWTRGNIVSSQRYYKELFMDPANDALGAQYVTVPTAYAGFPHEIAELPPRELAARGYNITQYTLFDDGGHFAAFEVPKELSNDVFQFAKTVVP